MKFTFQKNVLKVYSQSVISTEKVNIYIKKEKETRCAIKIEYIFKFFLKFKKQISK